MQKRSQTEEERGRARSGRPNIQSSALIQGCRWLQPWNSTRARCSTSWNGRKYARLGLQHYWIQGRVCASMFSSYIFCLQLNQSIYHSVHQLCCNSIFKVWSQLHLNCQGSGFTSNNINIAKSVWPVIVISSTKILMETCAWFSFFHF